MSNKPALNELPLSNLFDAISDDAASMAALIPTTASISQQFEIPDGDQPSEAELEESAHRIRTNFIEFNTMSLSLTRKHRLAVLAAATVFKAEALKVVGYLQNAFAKHGVEIATNTDKGQAINASVIRLLTTVANQDDYDKWDVSRNATAMKGVEMMCSDNNVELTFSAVDRVLQVIQASSRSGLMKIAAERNEATNRRSATKRSDCGIQPDKEQDCKPSADEQAIASVPSAIGVKSSGHAGEALATMASDAAELGPSKDAPEPYFRCDAPARLSAGQTFVAKVIDGQVWFFGPFVTGADVSRFV